MAFQLSEAVNKDRVFLVKRSELEGRVDPYYYKPTFIQIRENLKRLKFQPLNKFILSWNRGDGPREGFYTDDEENGVIFLRVNNLKNHSIALQDCKFITRDVHEKTLKRAQVTAGDVVFAISGTKDNLGTVSIIPDNILEANLNSAIVRIDLDNALIDKEFFCYLFDLDFVRGQIDFIGKGAAQNNLNNEEINQIHVPNYSLEKQLTIVNQMKTAFAAKKHKETQAQQLLDSMDTYLLNELAIELPVEEENAIGQRMFVRKFSEVSGGRFDAPGNWIKLSLESGVFESAPFSEVVAINPVTDFGFSDNSTLATFLPMESISELYAEANITQTREIGEAKGYTTFQEGDLIWAKITPCMENGKSAVVHDLLNGIGFGSTEYHVFRSNGSVNIHYIHALLRLKILRSTAVNSFSGSAGHQRVDELFFRKLSIPLPPIEKQNEIADHIQAIRTQAKQLRAEAAAGLEQAKQEVEAMILGEPCK